MAEHFPVGAWDNRVDQFFCILHRLDNNNENDARILGGNPRHIWVLLSTIIYYRTILCTINWIICLIKLLIG